MIEIPFPDGPGTVEAYLARPDDGEHPGVLLFVDAIGLRPQIEQMADRIAGWGHTVLVPHLFHREGSAAELAPTGDLRDADARAAFIAGVRPRVQGFTTARIDADVAAYLSALRNDVPGVGPGPFGVTGYCMGARFSLRAAITSPDVAACGGFHGGGLVTDADDSPHLGLDGSSAAYVFGNADQDRSMPAEAVERLGEALTAAGVEHTNVIYPGAPHGYTMADTSTYDEDAAERHYRELRELLAAHLHR